MRLAICLLCMLLAPAAHAAGPLRGDTLTVVTLNLWHDQHDWPRRLARIVRELRAIRPDVVCLQEVLQHATLPNQARTLADSLGFAWRFATVDSVTRVKRYGNAILTPHRVLASGERNLLPLDDYRTVGHARIEFHGRPLDVYDTHLHHTLEGAAIRSRQLADLMAYIDSTRGDGALVLAGDFNCSPDTPELQRLAPGYADTWAATHPGPPGSDAATMNPLFERAPRQIDHIFVARHPRAELTAVSSALLFHDCGPDSVWASDHFGVVARLALAPATAAATDSTYAQHLQLGRAALRRDDRFDARYHLLRVDAMVGGHTGAQLALAQLAARDADRDGALSWLAAVAQSGIAWPLARDTTFARWRDDTAFQALAARFAANAAPIARAVVAHELGDPGLLAEDVVWDARGGRFLVSSIHRRRIVALDRNGRVRAFTAPGADSTWGMYGLALDRARGLLWASTAAGAECDTFAAAEAGRTALVAFDLARALAVRRVELPRAESRQVLGDVTLGRDGTVYVSESLLGAVYRLAPGASRLETLVGPGTFRSPQQLALAADGRRLHVADYSRGVAVIDIARGTTRWLKKPRSLAAGGIDGLYRVGDRLIAIQNGTSPHRVLELTLSADGDAITAWRVLEQASERLGEPNHGVIVGDDFYLIGDSGWDRVGDDGRLQSPPEARSPVLLRLPLGPERARR